MYILNSKFIAKQILVLISTASSHFYKLVSGDLRWADDVLLDNVNTSFNVLRFKFDKMQPVPQLFFFGYVIYLAIGVLINCQI